MITLATAYLPPLDFFAAAVQAEELYIDTEENYQKQTVRNRAVIVTSQGPLTLSIPCHKPFGKGTCTKEVLISDQDNWQRQHWRSIVTAYNKSPYFLYYRDGLEKFYTQPLTAPDGSPLKLADYNASLMDFFIRKLKLPVERVSAPVVMSEKKGAEPVQGSAPLSMPRFRYQDYLQTFPCTFEKGSVSILDLMFNAGPEAVYYLQSAIAI